MPRAIWKGRLAIKALTGEVALYAAASQAERVTFHTLPAEQVFADIPEIRIDDEMLDLAKHIIKTKMGSFDLARFDDRYDAALAELIKAKREGREIKAPERPYAPKVVDLMEALRASAGKKAAEKNTARSGAKSAEKPAAAKFSARDGLRTKPRAASARRGAS